MMKIARPLASTDLSMTGWPFTPNDEKSARVIQHRTANEESGQCKGQTVPMAALFIRGSVLGSASFAESASAFSEQPRTRESGQCQGTDCGRWQLFSFAAVLKIGVLTAFGLIAAQGWTALCRSRLCAGG